jgi:flagellar basal body-associated protein FliL
MEGEKENVVVIMVMVVIAMAAMVTTTIIMFKADHSLSYRNQFPTASCR